ncbi:uncharacterized protein LOC102807687 [Saccoglossus kowalevskii]|uniref:Uncharacterized protein LOC102807687 n=1 Tax=Saccoglossus kowalevskii TaxID=10224 RepID=A0ABM0M5W1_SACKO|nr:PREDICTED: uncharacterized protein LOC102807687 [Saccoglossus kowalevskii]
MAYTRHTVKRISIALLVVGSLMVVFGVVSLLFVVVPGWPRDSAAPIWTGALAIAIGAVGIHSARTNRIHSVGVFFMVFNLVLILCSLFSLISVIMGVIDTVKEFVFKTRIGSVGIYIVVAILSFVSLVTSCLAVNNRERSPDKVVVVVHEPTEHTETSPPIVVGETSYVYTPQAEIYATSNTGASPEPYYPQPTTTISTSYSPPDTPTLNNGHHIYFD